MRIGVLDDVQPVSRPAFTIVFRPEQSIDQFFIGLGICVINELLNLFVSRWKSDQVVGHSANQRATVSRLRTSQSFLIQLVENELVDCGLCPRMIDLGNWWADQRPIGPPIKVIDTRFLERQSLRPFCARIDPLSDHGNFVSRKWISIFGHLRFSVVWRDEINQVTLSCVSGLDISTRQRRFGVLQRELTLWLSTAMTTQTSPLQKRHHLFLEDLFCRKRIRRQHDEKRDNETRSGFRQKSLVPGMPLRGLGILRTGILANPTTEMRQ